MHAWSLHHRTVSPGGGGRVGVDGLGRIRRLDFGHATVTVRIQHHVPRLVRQCDGDRVGGRVTDRRVGGVPQSERQATRGSCEQNTTSV